MATIKYSRQRESIKEYLLHTSEHPTADIIYMNIRNIYPNISLGTVYRNLNLLADTGEIIKFSCGDGCDRFDARVDLHNHFICKTCNQVSDIALKPINIVDLSKEIQYEGKIEGHVTYFYGTCKECLNKV